MSNSTSQALLRCPSRLARVSFRLVDEHGSGKPYAGLAYRITDRHGLDCSATLDEDGYAQVDNVHGGPLVVSFPSGYDGSDPWYRGLITREHFPISIQLFKLQLNNRLPVLGVLTGRPISRKNAPRRKMLISYGRK